jgi:thymidylate synthase (FAD)
LLADSHAQYEIRVYAEALAKCAKAVAPMAYEAFEEHVLGSVSLSRAERAALALVLQGKPHGLDERQSRIFDAKIEALAEAIPAESTDDLEPPAG